MARLTATAILDQLTDSEALALYYDWETWARPNQLAPPGNWTTWLVLAGRGWGKTRVGAEWVITQARNSRTRGALIAKKPGDVRDVMVEGELGILACSPPNFRPNYEPSKRRLTWPNGSAATCFSAETPDDLRGPQHHWAWADELAKFKYPQETWDTLMLGLRLGKNPQVCVTTTPRPIGLIKDLTKRTTCIATRGTTYDNLINLAPTMREQILRQYEGTRLGRQELMGEILDDDPDALFQRALIDASRVVKAPECDYLVVAVDPAATAGETSNETGIITAGRGVDGQYYVFGDVSLKGRPIEWGRAAVTAFNTHRADCIVYESNQGGDMVAHTLLTVDRTLPLRAVHASRGKRPRAEPIASLYEQGRVHHVGSFPDLEDQMCSWVPGADSPDRMDALVWAITALYTPVDHQGVRVYDSLAEYGGQFSSNLD